MCMPNSRVQIFQRMVMAIVLLCGPSAFAKQRSAGKKTCAACTHRLETGNGIWVRNPKRAYGLKSTLRLFQSAVERVNAKYTKTPALMVGDISFKYGGKMRPHRSHRDGRDIDAGFYFRDGRVRKYFARPRRKTLDVKRTWALFDALVSTGRVEYIFVSYRIQRALYRYALKQGVSKRRLNRLFQWPRHWRKRAGLIRWERGHEDHFHVRFRKDPVADPTREASQGE